jgi:hypothetical protein
VLRWATTIGECFAECCFAVPAGNLNAAVLGKAVTKVGTNAPQAVLLERHFFEVMQLTLPAFLVYQGNFG